MKDYRIRKEIIRDGKCTYRIEGCVYEVSKSGITGRWIALDYTALTIQGAKYKIDTLRKVGKLYEVESSRIIEYPPKS